MSDSKNEIDRKFNNIVLPQISPEMARTLGDFLLAAPGQHSISESAVNYVIKRLWVDPTDTPEKP